ncbi:keto-hydroxyglutarate-aldolase/keto-deoxy-phosphogluconate aldolase, partial [Salmonella enterica subsp. enterica serovar Newport str. VA_R100512572]
RSAQPAASLRQTSRDYLALKSVLCIGGSWLVPADALEAGDYDRITKLAREAVEGAKQ